MGEARWCVPEFLGSRCTEIVGGNPLLVLPSVLEQTIRHIRGFFLRFLILNLLFVFLPVWFDGRTGVQWRTQRRSNLCPW